MISIGRNASFIFIILYNSFFLSNFNFQRLRKMDRNHILHLVDEHLKSFPEATEKLASVINQHLRQLQNESYAKTPDAFVIQILKQEVFPRSGHRVLMNASQTLKHFLTNSYGNNVHMPHLSKLHAMSRSSHFNTLHKHGLVASNKKGNYHVTQNGIHILAKAHALQQAVLYQQNNIPTTPQIDTGAPGSVL